jgi:hypothetical protein
MASEAARLTAVVVFPTPPFWLAIATIWAMTAIFYKILFDNDLANVHYRLSRELRRSIGDGPNIGVLYVRSQQVGCFT